jgi:hypothetical protein
LGKVQLSKEGASRESHLSVKLVFIVLRVRLLEMMCIVSSNNVLRSLGIKYFGRWFYSAMHVLIKMKWIVGNYILGEYLLEYDSQYDFDNGILVQYSTFLLNYILARVMGNWVYSLANKAI